METAPPYWVLRPHAGYERDQRWYAKKRPAELAAVLRNLARTMTLLAQAPNARCLQAGFIHPEPHGLLAIDQRGGAGALQATRLYCYAHEVTRVMHLLAIGDKDSQPTDLARLRPLVRLLAS